MFSGAGGLSALAYSAYPKVFTDSPLRSCAVFSEYDRGEIGAIKIGYGSKREAIELEVSRGGREGAPD